MSTVNVSSEEVVVPGELPRKANGMIDYAAINVDLNESGADGDVIDQSRSSEVSDLDGWKECEPTEAELAKKEREDAERRAFIADRDARELEKRRDIDRMKIQRKADAEDANALNLQRAATAQWSQGWYILTRTDRVVKAGGLMPMTTKGFNATFAGEVGPTSKMSPYNTVQSSPGFRPAYDISYAAGHPEVFEYGGLLYVNSYRPSSAPVAAREYTPEGAAAVDTVRAHLRFLLDERSAQMVESWIALNVRNPGKIIGVALLVKGAHGDGKTVIFHNMMKRLMGFENVDEVSMKEAHSNFDEWATGRALRVFEELKAIGKNRREFMEGLKTFVTNESVRTVGKGTNGSSTWNTTNFVGLTNHNDALPMEEADRRWWILKTPFEHRNEFAVVLSKLPEYAEMDGDAEKILTAYFTKLHAAINTHSDALRKHFLECEIHREVFHSMRAPATEARSEMIAEAESELGGPYLDEYISGESEAEETAEKAPAHTVGDCSVAPGPGRYGVCADIIATALLQEFLDEDMGDGAPRDRQVVRLLKSRGFYKRSVTTKWETGTYNIWVKNQSLVKNTPETRKKVRELLDTTSKMPKSKRRSF